MLNMDPDNRCPQIGRRINLHGHKGTIKYIGEVHGTRGIWLGVEWDDPSRGKHSGEKSGKQYFICRVPGSGSFVRPSPSISYGQSFLQALASKYVELPHITGQKETVILGSSNGAIEVEAVGLDKVRSKLARLERLREISLDSDDVAFTDLPGEIRKTCPNVRSLDLSNSLLPSWDMVALIAAELSSLRALSLNHNRFSLLNNTRNLCLAFSCLEELMLDQTIIAWEEVILLTSVMPNLRYLELGYNHLRSLGGIAPQKLSSSATKLEVVNLDGNLLEEWSDIMISASSFITLERLILTSNRITRITRPPARSMASKVKHLGLQDNLLSHWSDIDALNIWLPELETLNISGNPLVSGLGSGDFRQQVIARFSSLISLNGTLISAKERSDSEIYYLSLIARSNLTTDEERSKEHPRWRELCQKHGAPEVSKPATRDTLAGRLISINVHVFDSAAPAGRVGTSARAPVAGVAQLPPPLPLQVLPTMTLRVLRLKLLKALTIPADRVRQKYRLGAWLVMDGDGLTELGLEQESRDLAWWGIQDGSHIVLYTGENDQD